MRPCLLRTAVIVLARLVAGCATMVQRITIFFGCCLGVFLTPGWHCELNASDMLRSIRAIFSHEQNCTERYTFHQPGRPHCSHIWKHRYSSACSEAQPVFCSSVPLLLMLICVRPDLGDALFTRQIQRQFWRGHERSLVGVSTDSELVINDGMLAKRREIEGHFVRLRMRENPRHDFIVWPATDSSRRCRSWVYFFFPRDTRYIFREIFKVLSKIADFWPVFRDLFLVICC